MKQITNKEYAGKAQKLRKDEKKNESCLIMYSTEDGLTKVEATFDQDTVWLLLDQMAELFQCDKSTISWHIKNVFSESELVRSATVASFATVQMEGRLIAPRPGLIGPGGD